MIVDDEESIRRLVSATLGGDDRYRVVIAKGGEEALELARQEKPDLAFLDIRMPQMDGYSVCRALKADPATAHINVVMLPALVEDYDREKAMEAGASDYITKPFSPTALLQKVEDVLDLT
jgi:putative two-component system response regulator